MVSTPEEALRLTKLLSDRIRDRRADIATAVSYLKGTEGRMKFASDEFKDYFEKRFRGFSDNWCMPVTEATVERIKFRGMRFDGSPALDQAARDRWERNEADRGLAEAVTMMTAARRSFGLVSPTPTGRARLTFENPDSAAVIYDPITRARKAGLTLWADDRYEYGELHLPGEVLSARREKVAVESGDRYVPPDVDGWEFTDSKVNPLGAVGLVELRNKALLDNDPISDIAGVMAMQDAINLVWAYLLNALDYASLPARVVTKADVPKEPILDKDGQVVGSRPIELDRLIRDRIMFIPGDNATIGEWSAANLNVFSQVIEHAVEHIAAQTRTPANYLLTGANVPATGYETAEAGLVSKAMERIGFLTPPVRELNRLMAIAEGDSASAAAMETATAVFAKAQYRSETQLMDGLLKMRQAGFPFQWIAEEFGLSGDDVKRVMDMIRDEQADPYLDALTSQQGQGDVRPDAPVVG